MYRDELVSVRATLLVLDPQQVESLVYDHTLGHTGPALLPPLEVEDVGPGPGPVVAQSGAAAGLLVADLHPVPVLHSGGPELDTGNPLDIIQTQRYAASLCLGEVAAERKGLISGSGLECWVT